jgi:hypothetical protein
MFKRRLSKLFFLPFILVFIVFAWQMFANADDGNIRVKFSETGYTDVRQRLTKLLKQEIEDAESLPDSGKVTLKIALVDLNNDGLRDVLAYVEQEPFFCGVEGCRLMVFVVRRNGEWDTALQGAISHEEIYVSRVKSVGFSNLILSGGAQLMWNGKQYVMSK